MGVGKRSGEKITLKHSDVQFSGNVADYLYPVISFYAKHCPEDLAAARD
ncbi:hypothetical protein SDC9_181871 [bioreactor metagenome]|uniref:Uncharacterized protein n=1 Tax=bioreactor metagenome TaxID=1076179 RepID=A0A645H5U9_9ZZZZ